MRPVFADPKTGVIFNKIFGQKAHKGLLIELLDALLELDAEHRIVDLEYLSPEQLPLRADLKLSILDVKCTDAKGTRYVVEMQIIEVEVSRSGSWTTRARPVRPSSRWGEIPGPQ